MPEGLTRMGKKMFEVRVYINTEGNIVIAQMRNHGPYDEEEYVLLEQSQAASVSKILKSLAWIKETAAEIKYAESIGHDFGADQEDEEGVGQPSLPGMDIENDS